MLIGEKFFALIDAANIVWDTATGNIFTVTLGGNRTMFSPTGSLMAGQRATFIVTQDGTGGRTLAWNGVFNQKWSNVGNVAGATSSISYVYNGASWDQSGAQSPYGVSAVIDGTAALAWAVTVGTPNTLLADYFTVTATSNIAATVPAPTNPPAANQSQDITFEIFNNSGGALTTPVAWNAIYLNSGGVSPANGLSIEVKFRYNQTRNKWIEVSRGIAV